MEIVTERLLLRRFMVSDITQVYLEALNDPSIIGMTEARHKNWNKENASVFIESVNNSSSILFGVFLKDSGKPIGNVRLFDIHSIHLRGELSLLFYDKSEWGNGFATEAVEAVVKYAFDLLKLHRITADYYANNIASSKVFKKAGFQIEGTFADHFNIGTNKYIDSIRVAKINSQ